MALLTMHPPELPRRRWRRWCLLAVYAVVVACASLVPRHGWHRGLGPVVPHDTFPGDCALCHTGSDWHTLRADFTFDHAARTGVTLQGAHAAAACLLCHNDRGPVAEFARQGCGGCHADPHLGRLGRNCSDCHDERTWAAREAIARHDRTRFPLVGAHAAAACFRCHPGAQVGNFAGASSACADCHGDDLLRATDPDHRALGYSRQCETCHAPTDWRPARFEHTASFPLSRGHAGRSCRECHTTPNVYTGLSTDCASCHLDDWQRTSDPPHAAAGYGTTCVQCHNTGGWRGAIASHPATFPLQNAHRRNCTSCHTTPGVFTGLSPACASCHLDDWQNSANPPHASFQISQQCQQCHGTAAWRPASFVHTFPITSGAHRGMACFDCHTNAGNRAAFSCIECHTHNQTTTNEHHQGVSGYSWSSPACYQCHPNGRH